MTRNVESNRKRTFLPQTVRIREETALGDVVILKVNARDRDRGENGRISYFLKAPRGNRNVGELAGSDLDGSGSGSGFALNEATGELRARGTFDREAK